MYRKKYQSTCCYCGVGCGISLEKDHNEQIQLEGDVTHPVNYGMLCSKGKNLHYTVNDTTDRLTYPQMRYHRNQPLRRVSWDMALTRTAAVFKTLIDKSGPDSVAFYASGQCLTEEYYVINKLIKGFIGSNNIDTNSRLCMSSAVAGYKLTLGEDCVPVTYDDIELCDVLFVAGANPAWCHPIIWRRVEQAKANNPHLKIIVSDPRQTQSADLADLHFQLNPGTDITLHHALGRVIIEQGYTDQYFIQQHASGFEDYKTRVFKRTIEEAAEICGIAVQDIYLAASWIGQSKAYLSMWTMGLNQSVVGVNKNLSLINLHLITGQIGKPGAGPFSLTGQPNAMGGREVGGLSNLLPAHRDLLNESHRREVERFWNIMPGKIAAQPGLTATEMFDALESRNLKAIWIICTNPLVSLPNVQQAEQALQKAKFVVVQEISRSAETLKYADVILPAAAWAEKEGTMTNAGRYITWLEKVTDPPGEAIPDAEIICRFANKMQFPGFGFADASAIFDEHVALTGGTHIDISGLNYDILKKIRAVQWPYPKTGTTEGIPNQGTSRLFEDHKFYTPSGKAMIHACPDENLSESLSKEFPLILTTGRVRDQWHTRSKTGKVNRLNQHVEETFVEIHPSDAFPRFIEDHSLVEVQSSRGRIRLKAKLTSSIKPGVVFIPMHWGKIFDRGDQRVNQLTNKLVDSRSKEPDFKFSAVEIGIYKKPKQKIIIVGAGAGAYGFVRAYRKLNTSDPIEIFSKENQPFYNRVLLPDYITDQLDWVGLVKMDKQEESDHRVSLHRGTGITTIDHHTKTIIDSDGVLHSYDRLILATGSRAATLRDLPALQGIFTLRTRQDADHFKKFFKSTGNRIVIIGGGLLGIEVAAALSEKKVQVTIVQRISRLMDRQLDAVGSQLLHESLNIRGIEIYYNDEIDRYLGQKNITGIKFKSGLVLECDIVLLAIGTQPNIELAKASGLECRRGVRVDEFLQTSDPSIYAIGEIAEFQGKLYGTTSAAEHQGEILAHHLSGDPGKYYQGSLSLNILKIQGLDVCSLGEVEIPDLKPGYEEIIFIDKAQRYYKKCIVFKDRLVGAILIGDKAEFLEYRNLIANKIELSEKRLSLLRNGQAPEPVTGRLICSCNSVGEGNLVQKMEAGCRDFLQLSQLTGAGTGCGSCRPEAKKIFEAYIKALQKSAPV
ncbi:MAG: molybdopterin-dependent oxidoreductase [Saprospiraceae bacterium]|nr:molybdopterin-dependent oxidoreductase [Saprospiraceae bacterium]